MRFGQAVALLTIVILIGCIAFYEFATPGVVQVPTRDEPPAAAPVEEVAPGTSRPLTVTIDFPSTFSGQTVVAKTNLPDDTQLIASLQPPDCTPVPDCSYVWWAKTTVKDGAFTLGPFGLKPGPYTLLITTPFSSTEPPEVRAVIGQNGENMNGPYVKAELVPGAGPTVEYIANITVPSTDPAQPESLDSASSPAEPSDPYAGEEHAQALAEYNQQRAAFLDKVRWAYFSVGCKVFASEAGIAALLGVEHDALIGRSVFQAADNIRAAMQSAARDGQARADKPGECDYWRQHPEAVYELRQEAVAAASAR